MTRGEENGARLGGKVKGWPHWTTPKPVLEVVQEVGPIALDPFCNEAAHTNSIAKACWQHAGLTDGWNQQVHKGLIFVNPPYSLTKVVVEKCIQEAPPFLKRSNEAAEIILLVAARTDTKWAHSAFQAADAVCFWRGRIRFENPPPESAGDAPSIPSMFVYWGPNRRLFMQAFGKHGVCFDLRLVQRRHSFPVSVQP
jgi:hypothetical protein